MSVIVKGMEMSIDCESCYLVESTISGISKCRATRRIWDPDPGQLLRPNWCPIRPLPEKHGDLVDIGQEVNIEYFDDINQEWSFKAGTVAEALSVCEEFPETIVEAEGE